MHTETIFIELKGSDFRRLRLIGPGGGSKRARRLTHLPIRLQMTAPSRCRRRSARYLVPRLS